MPKPITRPVTPFARDRLSPAPQGKLWRVVSGLLPAALVLLGLPLAPAQADQLVLRDLSSQVNVTVVDFDADGVLLVGATRLGWYQLKFGQVAPDRQADFDRWLNEVGEPLFRIRARLGSGDHRDLVELTEPLEPYFEGRQSSTVALLRLAQLRGHLSQGRRAAAFEAWLALRALPLVTPGDSTDLASLPWPTPIDAAHPYPPELPPVWFDREEAQAQFSAVAQRFAELPEPSTADRLMFASFALAANQASIATPLLAEIQPSNDIERNWLLILRCQEERFANRPPDSLAELKGKLPAMSPALAPLALYEIGTTSLQNQAPSPISIGLLDLLRIPAEYPQAAPDLISAALLQAETHLRAAGANDEADRLRRERARRGVRSSLLPHTTSSLSTPPDS